MPKNQSIIVIGEMNTDIVVNGLPYFPKAGELVNGSGFFIGPGGKSRNIAAMAGTLLPKNTVSMVSKTIQDKYGLWEEPLTALKRSGVDTEYVQVLPQNDRSVEFPGIALILVDKLGNNQIIGAPGITRKFNAADIDMADTLFEKVGKNSGIMAFIGNCPLSTAKHAIAKANQHGIKVVFDPGGADDVQTLVPLLSPAIYLFKPNVHEASQLTGIAVQDFADAKNAAAKIMKLGVKNVMITAGASGAYLFGQDYEIHIPIPSITMSSVKDETGCGDQTLATICAYLVKGKTLPESAKAAVLAGTLEFHKAGIQPITPKELDAHLGKNG